MAAVVAVVVNVPLLAPTGIVSDAGPVAFAS
jgi:hypothetical protein